MTGKNNHSNIVSTTSINHDAQSGSHELLSPIKVLTTPITSIGVRTASKQKKKSNRGNRREQNRRRKHRQQESCLNNDHHSFDQNQTVEDFTEYNEERDVIQVSDVALNLRKESIDCCK